MKTGHRTLKWRILALPFLALLFLSACSSDEAPQSQTDLGVMRQDLRKVPASVATFVQTEFDGQPGFRFTLTPKGREGGDRLERCPGRQRIELRDHNGAESGTIHYEIEFFLADFDDPNGHLETQVVVFQLKPQFTREGTEHIPYMTVELPGYYDEHGLAVYFDIDLRPGRRSVQDDRRAPLGLNRWRKLRTDVKWTDDSDGYARVYFNDALIAQYNGQTGPDQARTFAQFGLYRSDLVAIGSDNLETLVLDVRNYRSTRLAP